MHHPFWECSTRDERPENYGTAHHQHTNAVDGRGPDRIAKIVAVRRLQQPAAIARGDIADSNVALHHRVRDQQDQIPTDIVALEQPQFFVQKWHPFTRCSSQSWPSAPQSRQGQSLPDGYCQGTPSKGQAGR